MYMNVFCSIGRGEFGNVNLVEYQDVGVEGDEFI